MIATILEGHVTSEKWSHLEIAYRKGIKTLPHELVQTFLIHSQKDPENWQIVSIWRNSEEYEQAQREDKPSHCVEMFRSVGVEPTRTVFDLVAHHMMV